MIIDTTLTSIARQADEDYHPDCCECPKCLYEFYNPSKLERCKFQLRNLIADIEKLYPKRRPYEGLTRTVVASVTVHVWEKETDLKFDWSQNTGTEYEIALQMAKAELASNRDELSNQMVFTIDQLRDRS